MTNFQQLFQLGQQVQARLSQLQTELGNRTITTSSGGGMVTVTADGKGRVRQIRIDRPWSTRRMSRCSRTW
jgi:nucleoid-associated protein EbfC